MIALYAAGLGVAAVTLYFLQKAAKKAVRRAKRKAIRTAAAAVGLSNLVGLVHELKNIL